MIFNDKYNEIINFACLQDESLRCALSSAMSTLSQESVHSCERGLDINKSNVKMKNSYTKSNTRTLSHSKMIIVSGSIEYRMFIRNFGLETLLSLPIEERLFSPNQTDKDNEIIFSFEILRYSSEYMTELIHSTCCSLSLCNVRQIGYMLRYICRTEDYCEDKRSTHRSALILPDGEIESVACLDASNKTDVL